MLSLFWGRNFSDSHLVPNRLVLKRLLGMPRLGLIQRKLPVLGSSLCRVERLRGIPQMQRLPKRNYGPASSIGKFYFKTDIRKYLKITQRHRTVTTNL